MKSRSHRLPTISDTPDDWVDESWVVDCVCGVNFDDGEEMVDCDECGVWVHTRCSRYVKSEKLFACDKCKSKRLRKESEETEVAQLLVELPTKTLRMDNPYPLSFPGQNLFHVRTEVPMEEKVHVHGVPGGDTALFNGASSLFGPELWKCTGYVPKKFNHQYREFPCWDNRRDDDNDDDKKRKEDNENRANNGADALFSLSKENGELKTQVNGVGRLDMGPPSGVMKMQQVEIYEGRRVRKERSSVKPIVFRSGSHGDQNRKKNAKSMEKDGDSKKKKHHYSDKVPTTSSDAKQSESNEGKSLKVFKTDKQRYRLEKSKVVVQNTHKTDDNNPSSSVQPSENVDGSTPVPSKDAKQVDENDGIQVLSSDQVSHKKEDDMASMLIQSPIETNTLKHEDVNDANDNGRSSYKSNGSRSNTNNLEKLDSASNGELHPQIEVKAEEINHSLKTTNTQNVSPSDKTLAQDTKVPDDSSSASFEMKKEAVSVSKRVQTIDKDQPHIETKPGESSCGPSQPKEPMKGSENLTVARISSEAQIKLHGTVSISKGTPSYRKVTVSTVAKSAGKSSSKPSVSDKARNLNPDDCSSSGKQKSSSDDVKIKKDNNGEASEKPKKSVKDVPKSSSTSALKSSHLSKSSHAIATKKNSSDLKDSSVLSSSKTSSATRDSGDSASSLRSNSGAHEPNKTTSEKITRHHAPKNHSPHVHSQPPATLSDEELALLLHQELNSSPRVPRVPRMRNAGSLPQPASGMSTSTLMKRTSSSGLKDNGLVSKKKNKDLANTVTNSRESDRGKKNDKTPSGAYTRRHDPLRNGSVKVVQPPASTTGSGPSSSNEVNQNASDGETGAITHHTLPALLADIMGKGERMTYEELCNAVLPHWPNLRKHNGERYAYSSHSQAVLDCLRNRSEWSRLVDRGPKTNVGRKRRKSEVDEPNLESEDDDYSTDRNTKDVDNNNNGKRKTRKQRRVALQGKGIKDVRRRRKTEVSDVESSSSSESSEESEYSDEEMQEGKTSGGPNEASASSDETETMS
ncbi:uncharacterized protein [Rutidosis leptorrhynchoides]|uniref:uncharacterized protein n=1 Tax=Rutidosis leptorrhynchoides TaxID=125765 RepID=UPI003A99A04D